MAQRVKGQEVEIIVIVNSVPQTVMNAVRSFSMTYQQEIKSEGYLGETTNRKDSVFNGIAGRMEMHFDSPDIFNTFSALIDKARRRTPGTRVNIKVALNFPSGRRARVVIPDAEFGDIEVNAGSRGDYVTASMPFEASQASTIS